MYVADHEKCPEGVLPAENAPGLDQRPDIGRSWAGGEIPPVSRRNLSFSWRTSCGFQPLICKPTSSLSRRARFNLKVHVKAVVSPQLPIHFTSGPDDCQLW